MMVASMRTLAVLATIAVIALLPATMKGVTAMDLRVERLADSDAPPSQHGAGRTGVPINDDSGLDDHPATQPNSTGIPSGVVDNSASHPVAPTEPSGPDGTKVGSTDPTNDDTALEHEADVMGAKALSAQP